MPPPKTTDAGGLKISYYDIGRGGAILLLHGIGSNGFSWSGQFAALSAHHRVIAWDAPGYGGSSPLPTPTPAADDYADALDDFLDALGIVSCSLIGHSLGALMAASFAARYPDKLDVLVLASCALGYGSTTEADYPDTIRNRLADIRELGPKGLAEKRSSRLLTERAGQELRVRIEETMAEVTPEGYEAATHMLARSDIFADTSGIQCPTLVLCGDEDVITPHEGGKRVAAGIEGAQYVGLAGLGHACYVEGPDVFNDAVQAFLKGLD